MGTAEHTLRAGVMNLYNWVLGILFVLAAGSYGFTLVQITELRREVSEVHRALVRVETILNGEVGGEGPGGRFRPGPVFPID